MDQNTKDMIWTMVKLGVVGTAVGIPVGVWAMKRWNQPGEEWKTAILLTAVGYGVKEIMLRSPEVQMEEAVSEVEDEVAMAAFAANPRRGRAGWRRGPRRGMGAYMPAPAMPPAPSVYYPNLRQKANGRPVLQSGLNPTAL